MDSEAFSRVPPAARAFLLVVWVFATFACGYPMTDITATNTERTGDYEVVHAVAGESLLADVCVSNAARLDGIAERLVQQLVSHGYRRMTLNFYDAHGAVGRVEWSGADGRRALEVTRQAPADGAGTTPCRTTATGAADAAGRSEHDE
jgi:hypothetical protein